MKKIFTLLLLGAISIIANAQTTPTTQPYGKIDKADLELKACDFEKDANAEILFDKGNVSFNSGYELMFDRHTRLKIFNEKGKNQASVRIEYFGGSEIMSDIQAETINLNNGGAIEVTKIDKKLIYTQKIDKWRSALVFTFPNVQPGSVIEFKYTLICEVFGAFPDWQFQDRIPTRYSEFYTSIPSALSYKSLIMVNRPFIKNTLNIKAMSNIPSLPDEPYMSSRKDNYQRILYQLSSISAGAFFKSFSGTWDKVGEDLISYEDFGGQFGIRLAGQDTIITKAKSIKSSDARIAYIFDKVKNTMTWNKNDVRYSNEGTSNSWNKKTGNSTEINLILYHLLHKAGINAYPMLVSTKENGKVNPAYPNSYQFNRTVVYIPIDTINYYLLDATSKFNTYKEIPDILLNGYGFNIDKDNKKYTLIFLGKKEPVSQVVVINAEIKPDGNMTGTAQLNSFSYDKQTAIERYKTDGEKKYIDYLTDKNNNLKISSVKFENMDLDTLELIQNIDFNLNLNGADENYIYFNPNLFTSLKTNPFLSENRSTDIDFGYLKNYIISGIYKVPAGYKIDAMPKSVSMTMPDNSIIFKRIVAEQDGSVVVRFSIKYNKTIYFKEDYPEFHEFYKKMYDLLNEQIILKKS